MNGQLGLLHSAPELKQKIKRRELARAEYTKRAEESERHLSLRAETSS
uniref:Uncharacterized protein n=1 Tax=Utricularia reniformis TaxID=192314 RepID=A0A1Y0B3Y2_9LAMI|nr:hypothetical protein AEK19_MT1920 [Utricularia reniformis]ART32087.1 hypothetical protein AEK19_MT1920 [Utricularia reniformis]